MSQRTLCSLEIRLHPTPLTCGCTVPNRRATENAHVLRTRSQGFLPLAILKLGWRRWRYKSRLRPPLQELVRHNRLVTHHRYLAAQQQRQDIADRLRLRQNNKLRRARTRAEATGREGIDMSILESKPVGQLQKTECDILESGNHLKGWDRPLTSRAREMDQVQASDSGLCNPAGLDRECRGDSAQAHRRDRVTQVQTAHASADLCFQLASSRGVPDLRRSAHAEPEMSNTTISQLNAGRQPCDGQANLSASGSLARAGAQIARADGRLGVCQFGCGFSSFSQRVSALPTPTHHLRPSRPFPAMHA